MPDHTHEPAPTHHHGHHAGHGHGHGHGHAHGHAQLGEAEWQAWAEHTELDGEALVSLVTDIAARVDRLRGDDAEPVRLVLDIGSGPGVATCELARCFPDASAIAVDSSSGMLERAASRIARHDLDGRITVRLAELPDELATLAAPSSVDLIWASMSLHHMGDEVATLRGLRDLLAADGLLAIVEIAEGMATLPGGLGPQLEGLADHLRSAGSEWFAEMRAGLPGTVASSDLATMVAAAGLEVRHDEVAEVRFDPPLSASQRLVVLGHLQRTRDQLRDRLADDDRAVLDALCDPDDPHSVLHAPDLVLRATRRVVIAG